MACSQDGMGWQRCSASYFSLSVVSFAGWQPTCSSFMSALSGLEDAQFVLWTCSRKVALISGNKVSFFNYRPESVFIIRGLLIKWGFARISTLLYLRYLG